MWRQGRALAFLALGLLAQELRVENAPDGTKLAEYEVELDLDGREVKHGSYRAFHPDGALAAEGRFEHGAETGRWTRYHPNGAVAATGEYAGGLESGRWKTFFPDGTPESEGGYVRGARDGRWNVWRADGSKDLLASGLYRIVVYRSKEDARHYRGYFVDNERQGTWTSYWPDGSVQLEGSFAGGKRDGEWRFRHPDGTLSALLLTGRYADGAWDGVLEVPASPPFARERFPPIEPAPGGWPDQREALAAALADALRRRELSDELGTKLDVLGVPALPVALELVAALDPERAEDRASLGFLEGVLLRRICSGHTLSRHGVDGPRDAASARELVRAWLSLWALTRGDATFWQVDVPGPSRGNGLRGVLQDPPIFERDRRHAPEGDAGPEPAAAADAVQPAFRLRFGRAKEQALRAAPPGTKEAVARALSWLVAHQHPDGRWSNDLFAEQCGKLGDGTCSGPGAAAQDVGATALALLALLGDGHTPLEGRYREQVTRALDWLVRQQAHDGQIGERTSHDFLYGHAMATTAVCEAVGVGTESLRGPAERALAFLLSARNPDAGWRYDAPPIGQSDTSVTGWAVEACLAARHAGLAVDDAAFTGALAWIDAMTSAETGRVGYTDRGELSARSTANQHFPREMGEAMTGVGLLVRLRLGQAADDPRVVAHAKLVAAKPPSIHAEYGADQYHWYYGTVALREVGAPYWSGWERELRNVVLAAQQRGGDAEGSWDPLGPWGESMGRVSTTALTTLALECFVRYPRALDERK